MKIRETKFNTNPYCEIFRGEISECRTNDNDNKLLGFTVYYSTKNNEMSKNELLDKIVELSPPPHGIFEDKEGYLLRFELLEPIAIADDGHEDKLRESILRFLEENTIVQGSFQEMDIGRLVVESVQLDDGCEVIECL
jgi:hypothetical protein